MPWFTLLFAVAAVTCSSALDAAPTATPLTDVSRSSASPATSAPPPLPPPYDLKAAGSSDYPFTHPVSEYAHAHYDHYDHSVHAHSDDHPPDDYRVTPRDIAFGFLTFLVILSNLQGALINLSKNTNMVGIITSQRKRRALEDLLEDTQVRCVQHSVCSTNKQLSGELGVTGRLLGKYLNTFMARSVDARWADLVADAGAAGLAGVDCGILYRGCKVNGSKPGLYQGKNSNQNLLSIVNIKKYLHKNNKHKTKAVNKKEKKKRTL